MSTKRPTRSTYDLKTLTIEINRRNAVSTCSADIREGWNSMLSFMLTETNNYKGYGYLKADEVPPGHLPGVIMGKDSLTPNTFPDETRRFYYFPGK